MGRWIIDAGHGGKDNGAIGPGGRREKNISLDAALEAKRVLELNGEEVFLIRSNDIYMELKERVTYANGWGGDYYNKKMKGIQLLLDSNIFKLLSKICTLYTIIF